MKETKVLSVIYQRLVQRLDNSAKLSYNSLDTM